MARQLTRAVPTARRGSRSDLARPAMYDLHREDSPNAIGGGFLHVECYTVEAVRWLRLVHAAYRYHFPVSEYCGFYAGFMETDTHRCPCRFEGSPALLDRLAYRLLAVQAALQELDPDPAAREVPRG